MLYATPSSTLFPYTTLFRSRAVAAGGSVVDPKVVDVLVEARMRARNSPLSQLTKREREVLAGVAAGKSNAAIAESLFLTKRSEEHTSELQSLRHLVCRLLLE